MRNGPKGRSKMWPLATARTPVACSDHGLSSSAIGWPAAASIASRACLISARHPHHAPPPLALGRHEQLGFPVGHLHGPRSTTLACARRRQLSGSKSTSPAVAGCGGARHKSTVRPTSLPVPNISVWRRARTRRRPSPARRPRRRRRQNSASRGRGAEELAARVEPDRLTRASDPRRPSWPRRWPRAPAERHQDEGHQDEGLGQRVQPSSPPRRTK